MQRLFSTVTAYSIQLLSRIKNTQADALAKLVSTKDEELLKIVPVEFLAKPSIKVEPQVTMLVHQKPSWIDPIMKYLQDGDLPKNKDDGK